MIATILASLAISAAAHAAPAEILVIRHAEKPPGLKNEEGQHLGERGYERARALVSMFSNDARFLRHGTPVAIYAGSPKHPTGSLRPLETIEPTAEALGLTVITKFKAKSMTDVAEEILQRPEYEGKTVIASWTRDEIPGLTQALGTPLKEIPKWKSKTFDRVWRIDYDTDGKIVSFDSLPQMLLPGDSSQ
jgi:hypothetical protein